MRRRDFMKGAASLAALGWAGAARASEWGQAPDSVAQGLLLADGVRAESVLDLFCYGGVGPFESFYVVEDYGRASDPDFANQQWHLFEAQHEQVFGGCGIPSDQWLAEFATDTLGKVVKWGPATLPLRQRSDIMARTRVLVQRHGLEPHEAAIPLALSGMRLGSPRMAGLGAHVQRYHMDRDTSGRRVPYSYVLYPDNEIDTDNIRAASQVGLHPGSARPLDLRVTSSVDLEALLGRSEVGDFRDQYDRLVAHYASQAQRRYSLGGTPLRSQAIDDHRFATESMASADALMEVLGGDLFAAIPNQLCGLPTREDTTAMGLRLAAHLLTHPSSPAKHVTVVDGGMIPASGGGGFDVHSRHLPDTTRNLYSTLSHLVGHINEPEENDPSKIDLDKTMVVLNTEFGRTPFAQDFTLKGTNHHPYGYVTLLIGGPVGPEQRGILGAIGPDGWADRYVTPIETRAAVLAAMGLYPFSHESFAIGDLRERAVEKDGVAWLNEIVLGRKA